jgi:hypothetical protein
MPMCGRACGSRFAIRARADADGGRFARSLRRGRVLPEPLATSRRQVLARSGAGAGSRYHLAKKASRLPSGSSRMNSRRPERSLRGSVDGVSPCASMEP